jgi:hypothetical protein
MSDIQVCEGVWRNRVGQRVVVTQCEPVGGQRWTDGMYHVSDNGRFSVGPESNLDLVAYLGPFWTAEQSAEIERLRADWQREFTAAQQLRSEVQQLQQQLDEARQESQEWRANARAMDHHAEGMKAAFLLTIKALAGGRGR